MVMQACVLSLESFDDVPHWYHLNGEYGEEEQLILEWCIKDRSFFAFARRKQKRQARKGEREYFHQLPDPKKDLCLRLRKGEKAVVLSLVPKTGDDVQRALCKLGRRTYHITYVLRHVTSLSEANVEASDNSTQQQQTHSSMDTTRQYSPTSSLRHASRTSSSTKQSGGGNWLQNLMSPNKRNKSSREQNEDERPAKKRALPAWFMRLSKPRSNDRSGDTSKGPGMHNKQQQQQQQQQVDVHANATASNGAAAAAGNKLVSHPLPGLASATSLAGSRLSSNASNALENSGAQAIENAKDQQADLQSFPPQPQPQLHPPALVPNSAKGSGEVPEPMVVPPRPSSVPMTHAAPAKNNLNRPSTDRSCTNPLYDTTTSSPCTSNASPRPGAYADTCAQPPPRRVGLHVHSLSDVPLPPSQASTAALSTVGPLPMQQPLGPEDVQGASTHTSMQGSEGAPTLALPPVNRHQPQDLSSQPPQQQGKDGRDVSSETLQTVGTDSTEQQQPAQQPQQQERPENATVRVQTTPPAPPPPLSSAIIADARKACKLLDEVSSTLPPNKYKEYQQLLHSLILKPDGTEEGIARALLNSVLQEITPYDKGTPVPGLPGRFTKIINLKHEHPQPQTQPSQPQQTQQTAQEGAPCEEIQPHSSPLPMQQQEQQKNSQAPQQATQQQQPGHTLHRRTNSLQEMSDQQQQQSQLQLQVQLQNQGELQRHQSVPQEGSNSRHRRTTSLNLMQRLQKQLSEATRTGDSRKTVPVKEKGCQETLMLTLQYADADQIGVGAPTSCTCIAVAAAAWYEQNGPTARMAPIHYNQLIRRGANAWSQLCQDEASQSRLLDFVSVFEHMRKQPNWPCRHEVLEAYCQISAGGSSDPSTTFAQFAEGCMRQPGAYVLTVANHCTVVATRQDGTVEWANSLGRCLEPGCRYAHIAEFGSLEAFCAAYVAAHRPIQGVAQVEAHRIGMKAPEGGQRFEMYSS